MAQRKAAVLEARLALTEAETAMKAAKTDKTMAAAKKTLTAAEKAMTKAEKDLTAPITTAYAPNKFEVFPPTSTGRRLALAQWFASKDNPLTARVAVNHIWAHHFGRGLVPTLNEFGRNGQPPSHPQLLDWLAAELMGSAGGPPAGHDWSMKRLHRLIVTSSTYRMASTPDAASAKLDRDNVYLWRMNSRRMEAEIVRDNVLHVSGSLDLAMGGPDIDNKLGLTSKRRSVYLRIAPEKEVEFIKIFDGPNPVECYSRPVTVMPHQALAMANSELTFTQADVLAETLTAKAGNDDAKFITAAYERVLARKADEGGGEVVRGFPEAANGDAGEAEVGESFGGHASCHHAGAPRQKAAEAPKPAAKPVSARPRESALQSQRFRDHPWQAASATPGVAARRPDDESRVVREFVKPVRLVPPRHQRAEDQRLPPAVPRAGRAPGQRARENLVMVLFNHFFKQFRDHPMKVEPRRHRGTEEELNSSSPCLRVSVVEFKP